MQATFNPNAAPTGTAEVPPWRRRVNALRAEMESMAAELAELRRLALRAAEPEPTLLSLTAAAGAAGVGVELDGARRELRVLDGVHTPVQLTVKEFELLRILLGEPGRVFSRESLQRRVWGIDNPGQHRNVDAHIARLRHKLASAGHHLEGRYGAGYRWAAATRGGDAAAGAAVAASSEGTEMSLPVVAGAGATAGGEAWR